MNEEHASTAKEILTEWIKEKKKESRKYIKKEIWRRKTMDEEKII
jgi:hypothetical protein